MKLPTDCGYNMSDINVIAIGNGKKFESRWQATDTRVRHAYLKTAEYTLCNTLFGRKSIFSIICAFVRNGQSIHNGDSGNLMTRFILFT